METTLTEIAVVVTAALGCGIFLEKLKQPAILGYILAGVLLGPSIMGFVHARESVSMLAELGMLMLLFLVGVELSLRSFIKIWHITLGCVFFQVAAGLALTITLGAIFSWPLNLTILLACVFALSSTAVAVKMMESIGELRTNVGKLAVGVLIAQDLAIVPMILVIRGIGDENGIDYLMLGAKLMLSIGFLVALVLYLSRKERIKLPFIRLVVNNHDLTPIMGLTFCFGFAAVAGLLGLSAAYGAFLAGLILGNSNERHVMIEKMTPIYSVLMMIFFLSIGLLMDIGFIAEHFWKIMVILLFITVGKTALNVSILHMLKQPWLTSFSVGVLLAQLGEFSFLLSAVGMEVGIVNDYGSKLIISMTVLSLAFSPLWQLIVKRLHDRALRPSASLKRVFNVACGRELRAIRDMLAKNRKSKSSQEDTSEDES